MTTTTIPTFSYRARVESLLAGIVAAIAIFVLLLWVMVGITDSAIDDGHSTPVPSPQASPEQPAW